MKKTLSIILMMSVACSFIFSQKKDSKMITEPSYDLVINGYDWGPAVDKIILHASKTVSPNKIKAEEFSVGTDTFGYNWTAWPPKLDLKSGTRVVTAAYACDENGNQVEEKSNHIALEMTVHPEDMFSNPFLYGSDMMNHWQQTYDVTVTNKKLKLEIKKLGKKICPLADQFVIGESTTADVTLHYGLYKPENAAEKTPVIIWLHGMGEGGNDPYIALLGNKVVNLITPDVQRCFGPSGAYVLVPQVNGFWMQTDIKAKGMDGWISDKSALTKSYYTEALFNLIQEVVKNNPQIDPDRIYIGGCSNGGYMTVNMILEYPDYFAAAYPVCEAYPDVRIDEEKLAVIAKQHVWFTQSKDDKTVNPPQYSVATVERLRKLNAADIHFSLWENVVDETGDFYGKNNKPYVYNGHFSWIYTLNNRCVDNGISIFRWMSEISKSE